MSTIVLPDPHPGRCKNLRMVGSEMLRCLDYENVSHRCSFPEPTMQPVSNAYCQCNNAPERAPWVKPDDRSTSRVRSSE